MDVRLELLAQMLYSPTVRISGTATEQTAALQALCAGIVLRHRLSREYVRRTLLQLAAAAIILSMVAHLELLARTVRNRMARISGIATEQTAALQAHSVGMLHLRLLMVPVRLWDPTAILLSMDVRLERLVQMLYSPTVRISGIATEQTAALQALCAGIARLLLLLHRSPL